MSEIDEELGYADLGQAVEAEEARIEKESTTDVDTQPPLDPELAELVTEKRAEHADDPQPVTEVEGRRLS